MEVRLLGKLVLLQQSETEERKTSNSQGAGHNIWN